MDIHLADGDSFRIFGAVEVDVPVIFTTAYDRYALEAFKVNSIDYLLKPLNGADVSRAIDKFRRLTGSERRDYGTRVKAMAAGREETFLVQVRDKIIPLHRDKIAFCHTFNEKVTAYGSTAKPIRSTGRWRRCKRCCRRAIFSGPTASSSCAPRREGDRRVVRQPAVAVAAAAHAGADRHFQSPRTRIQSLATVGSRGRIAG